MGLRVGRLIPDTVVPVWTKVQTITFADVDAAWVPDPDPWPHAHVALDYEPVDGDAILAARVNRRVAFDNPTSDDFYLYLHSADMGFQLPQVFKVNNADVPASGYVEHGAAAAGELSVDTFTPVYVSADPETLIARFAGDSSPIGDAPTAGEVDLYFLVARPS